MQVFSFLLISSGQQNRNDVITTDCTVSRPGSDGVFPYSCIHLSVSLLSIDIHWIPKPESRIACGLEPCGLNVISCAIGNS